MPSNYAHKHLGEDVYKHLNQSFQTRIDKYRDLFFLGLHGPDVLFYYKPLSSNHVNRLGHMIHRQTGEEFFSSAIKKIRESEEIEACLVYAYGYLCHFAMDTICHGYIIPVTKQFPISHAKLEVEFDRLLMIADGLDPVRHKICNHIVASEFNASIMNLFYEGITLKESYDAIKDFRKFTNFLVLPGKMQRKLVYLLMKVINQYDSLKDMTVGEAEDINCRVHLEELLKQYPEVLEKSIQLILEFEQYMDGSLPFDKIFSHTFDADLEA